MFSLLFFSVTFFTKAKKQWNSCSSWIKFTLLGLLGLGIAWSFYRSLTYMTRPAMGLLISGLEGGEGEKIVSKLESLGISYKIDSQGTSIYMAQDIIPRTRMLLAEQQLLPHQSTGIGYEIFDRQDYLGSNTFLQELNHTRALEGELGRTLSSLEGVKSVRVHISPAEKNKFAFDKKNTASAAVYLRMHVGKKLKTLQIQAIKSLLKCSIPYLQEDKITLMDQSGRVHDGDSEDSSTREVSLARNLESLVERFVGFGHVKVRVNISSFTDHWVTEGMEYNPDTPVVKKTKSISSVESQHNTSQDTHESLEADVPGHSPLGGSGGGESQKRQKDESVAYHVSHTKTYREMKPGRIQRISVAVLIDGSYLQEGNNVDPMNMKKKQKLVYVPRSNEELDHIRKLVSQAAGLQLQRGDSLEVINLPFFHVPWTQDHEENFLSHNQSLPTWVFGATIFGILILLSIFVTLFWVWVRKKPDNRFLEDSQATPPPALPLELLPQEKLEKLAQERPDIFAQVLKSWLRGTSL